MKPTRLRAWKFTFGERIGLFVVGFLLLAFGGLIEQRTALRRVPMTDLSVPTTAGWAVINGENIYTIQDFHGWHYGYPPPIAILFVALAESPPARPSALARGELRTEANTPWGFEVPGKKHYYRLDQQNRRFFCIIAIWYLINVFLIGSAAHTVACALEKTALSDPPPLDRKQRRDWWLLRTLPLLVCIGSLLTELSRGQVDVLMLAAIAWGLYFATRGQESKSGFCLAIPATIKLFPVLLLGYPLWRGRWRMLAAACAALVLLLAVLPAMVLGPDRTVIAYKTWVQVLAKPGLGVGDDKSRARELTSMNSTDNQSLLAFFHNWRYHSLIRNQRPPEADRSSRVAVYVVAAIMLLGIAVAFGRSRSDSPRDLFLICGLLIGLALVANPVVHNFYYLLLIPLIAALLDYHLTRTSAPSRMFNLPNLLLFFMLIDILARIAPVGPWLRDVGAPLLSVVALLIVAMRLLLRRDISRSEFTTPVAAEVTRF